MKSAHDISLQLTEHRWIVAETNEIAARFEADEMRLVFKQFAEICLSPLRYETLGERFGQVKLLRPLISIERRLSGWLKGKMPLIISCKFFVAAMRRTILEFRLEQMIAEFAVISTTKWPPICSSSKDSNYWEMKVLWLRWSESHLNEFSLE